MSDRRGQDEQGEPLERRLHRRLPRGERGLDDCQATDARDVEPRCAGEIAEAHAQLGVTNAAVSEVTVFHETVFQETVSQETVSQETVSQETVSHETVSHETLR